MSTEMILKNIKQAYTSQDIQETQAKFSTVYRSPFRKYI